MKSRLAWWLALATVNATADPWTLERALDFARTNSPDTRIAFQRAVAARAGLEQARSAFEAALAEGETGDALEGLGLAAWWLDLADIVFDARERAYRIYHEQHNRTAAARVAVWLAWDIAPNS